MKVKNSLLMLLAVSGLVCACNETSVAPSGNVYNPAREEKAPVVVNTPTPTATPKAPDNLHVYGYSIKREYVETRNVHAVVHRFATDVGSKAKYQFIFCELSGCKDEAFIVECRWKTPYCDVKVSRDGEYEIAERSRAYYIDRTGYREWFVVDPHFNKLPAANGYQIVAIDADGHKSEPLRNTGNGEVQPDEKD